MWITIAEAILAILGILSAVALIFTPAGRKNLSNFITNVIGGALDVAVPLLDGLENSLSPIAQAFVNSLNAHGGGLLKIFKDPAAGLAEKSFKTMENKLLSLPSNLPEDAPIAAAAALGEAFGFGIGSAGVTALFEAVFPEKLNALNAAGPILSELSGFKEVAEQARDPLYRNAFGVGLEYYYRSVFKPELPSEGDAVTWHSRRLLDEEGLRKIFKYSGLKAEYEPAYMQSAYRAIQPRALSTAFEDAPFPRETVRHILEFGGLRPQDLPTLLDALEANSTKNVRHQYLAAVEQAAMRGALTDAELISHLDSMGFSDQAKNFVRSTVATHKLQQLEQLYREQVSVQYHYGDITDITYIPALEAVGVAHADANAHYGIDAAKKHGKAVQDALREIDREHREIIRNKLLTAREAYAGGTLDDVGYAVAVAASGLPLSIVPSAVAAGLAAQSARRVDVSGRLVTHAQAILLREKIAALQEQAIKKLGTPALWLAELKALEIPDANAQALVAKWEAQAHKIVLPL